MSIGVLATLTVKPGTEAEFERLFALQAANVRANEPANTLYTLCRSRSDAGVYVVMELYDDDDALAAHREGAHMAEYRPQIGPLIAAPAKIEVFDVT